MVDINTSGKKILIVEDDLITQLAIEKSVLHINCEVCAMVSSGEDAIIKAKELKPDLILMDIFLDDDMDGTQAANIIHKSLGIPIIFITATSHNSILKKALLSIPSGFLVKPYQDEELWIQMQLAFHRKSVGKKDVELTYPGPIQEYIKNNELVLVYEGHFTQQIVISTVNEIDKYLSLAGANESSKSRLIHTLIECLQNMSKYAVTTENSTTHDAVFIISQRNETYSILTGNYVSNEDANRIESKLGNIKSLNEDELRNLHKETRLHGIINEKGGAGLGFIDIARKSGVPLEYNLKNIDKNTTFFTMQITIAK
ncbi:MAG: hypothetical protein COC01_02215 [Bacteroidetes bacterium]|nr:MAG: hypothetical protein COC01_02215 [Bacteroidota bacterium]